MPGSLPAIPGAKAVKALERAGFIVVRISGSHHVMRHPDGRTVVVPIHAGRDMPKGTLRNILAIIGMAAPRRRRRHLPSSGWQDLNVTEFRVMS